MKDNVKITSLEVHEFQYELQDHGYDYNGLFAIYKKGSSIRRRSLAIKIHTRDANKKTNPNLANQGISNQGIGVKYA